MSQWPQQPPYDPYQQPQQQPPYQNQQPYNPVPPTTKPGGGSIIKTLNFFSSKPSYVDSSSSTPLPPVLPSSTQYVASPQSYTQPPAPWTTADPTPAAYPPPAPQAYPQPPIASYNQSLPTYQSPAPPPPPSQPTPTPSYTSIQTPLQPPPPQSPISPSASGSSHGRDELVQKLQTELDDTRKRLAEKEEELLRARHDATQLQTQVDGIQRQLALAQQEAQQLRANAETNHKLAVEKDQELGKIRKETLDLQTAQGQELERTKQAALALRQQLGQLTVTQQEAQQLRVNAETNHKLAVDKDQELGKIRKEILDLQTAQGQELERAKQEALALRQQLGQLTVAQQEAQQLRVNAETNHKLAIDKDQELSKLRKEMLDLQVAQGQELERARQEALALRQQVDQNTPFQEAYRRMYEDLHVLKATMEKKDAEIARLNQAIAALPISPVTTPPVFPLNAEIPPSGLGGANTSPQPQPPPPPPQQPFWQPAPPDPSYLYQPPVPPSSDPIAGVPATWVTPGSQPTVPGVQEADLPQERTDSEKEWQRQKDEEGESNDAIDLLMTQLTGLETVKAHFLRVKSKIDTAVRQGVDLKQERFDIVLLGNPGTGKTDVAQVYSLFMCSYGILPADGRVFLRGSELLTSDGLSTAKNWIEKLHNVGGGVFVLDDAHYLTQNELGIQIIDYILAQMESYENYGKIVFVFAGHNKTVELHPGLATKIPCVLQLEDYTDRELHQMLRKEIDKRYKDQMQVEGGMGGIYMRILIRRLGRGRGSDGFGNAREVEKAFTRIRERQGDRLNRERRDGGNPGDFYFTKEDLIGPDPSQAFRQSTAWKKLSGMIGLSSVKESVLSMIGMIETNYKRELQEKSPMEISLNRVFLGSPGTGKTTVAKYYGQILVELGLLSNGEVVTKSPADFVGNYLGQTENKTKAILAAAVGKVLIIDEAYMLYPAGSNADNDIYKTAVIDTLVAEVQSTPGEDRCVLLLGYEKQMETMFQNVNPGLARRFAIENAFHFHDFSEKELQDLLKKKLEDQELHATGEAKRVAGEVLARARVRPNFGNGGEVENIISQAKVRYQTRISKMPAEYRPVDVVFEPQDFDPEFARGATAATNCKKLFEDTVGCEDIIAKLEGYQKIAVNAKAAGVELRELIPTNFVFKGPPGTGKTMTARKMGRVFYDMGFLSSDKVVECSASDLIGQYLGQTGPKTQKLFEKALGQVLFIDEAYRLGEGQYSLEAVNELVDILTKPTYLGKIIVILAGYDDDMNQLLAVNSGLSSRFPETISFKNMSPEHCLKVLQLELQQKKITALFLTDTNSRAYRDMRDVIVKLSALPSWGNARDVKTLAKTMIGIVYKSSATPQANPTISPEDALRCARQLLEERKARANVPQVDPMQRRAQSSYQSL